MCSLKRRAPVELSEEVLCQLVIDGTNEEHRRGIAAKEAPDEKARKRTSGAVTPNDGLRISSICNIPTRQTPARGH